MVGYGAICCSYNHENHGLADERILRDEWIDVERMDIELCQINKHTFGLLIRFTRTSIVVVASSGFVMHFHCPGPKSTTFNQDIYSSNSSNKVSLSP
jgi:hypothetical protein